MTRAEELKKLDKRTRNKVRAILSSSEGQISNIASLKKANSSKGALIDEIFSHRTESQILSSIRLFPPKPAFTDKIPAPAKRELTHTLKDLIDSVSKHKIKIENCIESLKNINTSIINGKYSTAIDQASFHLKSHGWSHVVLRKLALLKIKTGNEFPHLENLLNQAGMRGNNVTLTSLLHCFAEEQNYLTTKKAVLNLSDRGLANLLTRTLSRIPFHPIAKDPEDASLLIQCALNCSLIDGIICAKVNTQYISNDLLNLLKPWNDLLENSAKVECIAKMHSQVDEDTEYQFLKESSAWLELDGIVAYRTLCDNFYDAIESNYITITPQTEAAIDNFITSPSHESLAGQERLVKHEWKKLEEIQNAGTVTRSAAFNYWLYRTNGEIDFREEQILKLMTETRDLARTVPIGPTRKAGQIASNRMVRLTLFLLLAKRSKNERDDSRLRDVLQKITITNHEGSLLGLVRHFEENHWAISDYIYDIATEDFIAKLFKITPDVFSITNTRAALHNWRAEKSGEKIYADRARAIQINYQLNKIRGEIDDNRIYVDATRFSSWINDEVLVDLNTALTTSNAAGKGFTNVDEAVVKSVVEKCFAAFCTHSTFGIASYLGRRIRHGTFKGQLYTSVINTAEGLPEFLELSKNSRFLSGWNEWKTDYLSEVETIVNRNLHVESIEKPEGLIKPHLGDSVKQEMQTVAAKNIISVYEKTRTTDTLDVVITEYCWRMADIDLKAAIAALRLWGNKTRSAENLLRLPSLISPGIQSYTGSKFTRALLNILDAKMKTMLNWFQKPLNVSPRASIIHLYSAVAAEVRDVFPDFRTGDEANIANFDVIGSAYHNIYDCLYVILYNAAKHGDIKAPIDFKFSFLEKEREIKFQISSSLRSDQSVTAVAKKIFDAQQADLHTAHLRDNRSGLLKLRQLEQDCPDLVVDFIGVQDRKVVVSFNHSLAQLI